MARHRRAFRGRRMLGRVGGYVQSIVSRLGGLARVAELLQPQIGVASLNARPVGLAAMAGWSVRGCLTRLCRRVVDPMAIPIVREQAVDDASGSQSAVSVAGRYATTRESVDNGLDQG